MEVPLGNIEDAGIMGIEENSAMLPLEDGNHLTGLDPIAFGFDASQGDDGIQFHGNWGWFSVLSFVAKGQGASSRPHPTG